ncbi:hypothetical protein ACFE04_012783 [Oxalis oulophora]
MRMKSSRFKAILKEAWYISVTGHPMYRMSQKLKSVKKAMKQLNKIEVYSIFDRFVYARLEVERIQIDIQSDPVNPELLNMEITLVGHLKHLLTLENDFYK